MITIILNHNIMKPYQFMLGLLAGAALVALTASTANLKPNTQYEFTQVTVIESVVPAGLGRSRMITIGPDGQMEEIKMENFFSLTGINFSNIRANDQAITNKVSQMHAEGWELQDVTSGVYGSGAFGEAGGNNTGIFMTRYLFRRAI